MRRLLAILTVIALLLPLPVEGAACQFKLGFKALADQLPLVGACLEDEHANPQNGDALQRTDHGLLVWRKADNFTAFTDGTTTWVNGPLGVQQRLNTERFDWESAAVDPNVVASGLVKVNGVCYEIGGEPGGFYARLAQQYHYAHTAVPRDCSVPIQPAPASPSMTCFGDRAFMFCR